MRLSIPFLLATFAQVSSAFYPYIPLPDTHSSLLSTRDSNQQKPSLSDLSSPITADVDHSLDNNGEMRISLQRRPTKRQNKFSILLADSPQQSNSAGVNQDGTDFSYFASLKFGSSTKTFFLLLDSAASNTWVMSADCTTSACGLHTTFGSSDSSSLKVRYVCI